MFRTKMNGRDFVAAGLVLAAALLLLLLPLLWREEAAVLEVSTPAGTKTYSLAEDRSFAVASGEICLTVEIREGRVRVRESNCPDGVCRASREIASSGESILCAPGGIRLLVRGGDGDVDFVAG